MIAFIISRLMVLITSCYLSPASAAVETTPAAVEAAESPAVETAKAGLSPKGTGSRHSAMIEPAEGP